jgi:hypothetical protein
MHVVLFICATTASQLYKTYAEDITPTKEFNAEADVAVP